MADRDNIIRMAREAGFEIHERKQQARVGMDALVGIDSTDKLQRFAELVKADFLQSTGQYLANDASREAVIADAVAEEREACARHIRCGAPPLGRRGNRIEIGEEARSAYAESVLERGRHG